MLLHIKSMTCVDKNLEYKSCYEFCSRSVLQVWNKRRTRQERGRNGKGEKHEIRYEEKHVQWRSLASVVLNF